MTFYRLKFQQDGGKEAVCVELYASGEVAAEVAKRAEEVWSHVKTTWWVQKVQLDHRLTFPAIQSRCPLCAEFRNLQCGGTLVYWCIECRCEWHPTEPKAPATSTTRR